jgi:hypothetical protein|tara:strand:- start:15706 stop:16494 length:789 start_codon:yes stop_codon:yes gene_type:complete
MNKKVTFCTTVYPQGFQEYAQKTFCSYVNLPPDSSLVLFTEDFELDFNYDTSCEVKKIDLFTASPKCKHFVDRHAPNPRTNSYKVRPYKKNYLKFCYKVYAMCQASRLAESDFLVWIDSDIYIKKALDEKILDYICDDNYFIAYLNRENSPTNNQGTYDYDFSETGLISFNLKHSQAANFFDMFEEQYNEDLIFQNEAWDDTSIFDLIRAGFEKFYGVKNKKLSSGKGKFPLEEVALLKEYFFHPMGDRKLLSAYEKIEKTS